MVESSKLVLVYNKMCVIVDVCIECFGVVEEEYFNSFRGRGVLGGLKRVLERVL